VEIKKRNKELKGILNIFFELKKSKLFFLNFSLTLIPESEVAVKKWYIQLFM
jgi:hypothetical protein